MNSKEIIEELELALVDVLETIEDWKEGYPDNKYIRIHLKQLFVVSESIKKTIRDIKNGTG